MRANRGRIRVDEEGTCTAMQRSEGDSHGEGEGEDEGEG
jgi:hypothetical protein